VDAWTQWAMGLNPVWAQSVLAVTPRGHTGHERIDAMGIIHMNGRIYLTPRREIISIPPKYAAAQVLG